MLTKEELYLLRTYLGLMLQDVGELMLCTKQTIWNIETGKSTQQSTALFYEKTLLEVLANKTEGPKTYEEYCKVKILEYQAMLWKYELSKNIATNVGLQQYLENDIAITNAACRAFADKQERVYANCPSLKGDPEYAAFYKKRMAEIKKESADAERLLAYKGEEQRVYLSRTSLKQ